MISNILQMLNFSWSLEQIFLKVDQNKFGNKIPFPSGETIQKYFPNHSINFRNCMHVGWPNFPLRLKYLIKNVTFLICTHQNWYARILCVRRNLILSNYLLVFANGTRMNKCKWFCWILNKPKGGLISESFSL